MNSRKSTPISYLDDGLFWAESGFFSTLLGLVDSYMVGEVGESELAKGIRRLRAK